MFEASLLFRYFQANRLFRRCCRLLWRKIGRASVVETLSKHKTLSTLSMFEASLIFCYFQADCCCRVLLCSEIRHWCFAGLFWSYTCRRSCSGQVMKTLTNQKETGRFSKIGSWVCRVCPPCALGRLSTPCSLVWMLSLSLPYRTYRSLCSLLPCGMSTPSESSRCSHGVHWDHWDRETSLRHLWDIFETLKDFGSKYGSHSRNSRSRKWIANSDSKLQPLRGDWTPPARTARIPRTQ